jgi:hypothetical protein
VGSNLDRSMCHPDGPCAISGWIGEKLCGIVAFFAPNSEIWTGEKGNAIEDLGSMVGSYGVAGWRSEGCTKNELVLGIGSYFHRDTCGGFGGHLCEKWYVEPFGEGQKLTIYICVCVYRLYASDFGNFRKRRRRRIYNARVAMVQNVRP